MTSFNLDLKDEKSIHLWAKNYVCSVADSLKALEEKRLKSLMIITEKVLKTFSDERLGTHHFSSLTGYAHGDQGREVIDRIFATILGAEKAAVRLQIVSGTHAISSALYGVLRPGDLLLSVTGKPYDTLEEVIGIRGKGKGSLIEFGITYEEINISQSIDIDYQKLDIALKQPTKMVFIQRSCGYSLGSSLSLDKIKNICSYIHNKDPQIVCFVDNCYGEFVEDKEPCEVGADLIAGSLIKNLGGTIVTTGGYIAGRKELVEQACCRLTAPGIGSKAGTGFDLHRLILQGLFLSPQMVTEALIGADLVCGVFQGLGYKVSPRLGEHRTDLIQAVQFNDPEALKVACRSLQASSPVGSYLDPVPSSMPGYKSDLIMAGGTFIDGSTSEFSADAPLRPPFNLFVQGGTSRSHVKIALIRLLVDLVKADMLTLPQTKNSSLWP